MHAARTAARGGARIRTPAAIQIAPLQPATIVGKTVGVPVHGVSFNGERQQVVLLDEAHLIK